MKQAHAFWDWFTNAHHRLESLDGPHKDALLTEVQVTLHEYSPGLWFEIGGHPDGPHELVISAEGNSDYFEDVRHLVAEAPTVEGWSFIAFKPPHGFDFQTVYEGVAVEPANAWFLPLVSESNPASMGLRVAVPGFTEEREQTYWAATMVALEAGLGELVAAEAIAHLEVCAPPDAPEENGYIELNELEEYLAWRSRRET